MADEEKTNTKKAVKQEPASPSAKEKPQETKEEKSQEETTPQETTTEGGASGDTSASPSPGQVTLSQEQMERLRRKLKAKYH